MMHDETGFEMTGWQWLGYILAGVIFVVSILTAPYGLWGILLAVGIYGEVNKNRAQKQRS
jgi:uncharacterized membrane protein YccF (DUF307 family)